MEGRGGCNDGPRAGGVQQGRIGSAKRWVDGVDGGLASQASALTWRCSSSTAICWLFSSIAPSLLQLADFPVSCLLQSAGCSTSFVRADSHSNGIIDTFSPLSTLVQRDYRHPREPPSPALPGSDGAFADRCRRTAGPRAVLPGRVRGTEDAQGQGEEAGEGTVKSEGSPSLGVPSEPGSAEVSLDPDLEDHQRCFSLSLSLF